MEGDPTDMADLEVIMVLPLLYPALKEIMDLVTADQKMVDLALNESTLMTIMSRDMEIGS